MNALTSQGTPIFGSTLERGVISAPARLASPAPMQNVTKRTCPLLMPSPRASGSFIITARASRPSPGCVKERWQCRPPPVAAATTRKRR